MTDLYAVLGVPRDASAEGIRRAFRRKAMRLHPDAGGTTEEFQALSEAYRVLSDPDARAAYDATGHVDNQSRVDVERQAALTLIDQQIGGIIEKLAEDPGFGAPSGFHDDLVAAGAAAADKVVEHFEAEIEKTRRRIVRLADIASRFSARGEAPNTLSPMVQYRIRGHEQRIGHMEANIKLHRLAALILREHSFRIDEIPSLQHHEGFVAMPGLLQRGPSCN